MSDSKSLAQKIRERQKLVERIVGFVEKIVLRGERTQYSQGSFNTHTVWELKNLAGFSFKGDFGQTLGESVGDLAFAYAESWLN